MILKLTLLLPAHRSLDKAAYLQCCTLGLLNWKMVTE